MASKDALKAQAQGSAPQIRIAGLIWLISAMIVMAAAGTWLALAVMTGDYLGNGKAVRDAAEAGSGLLSQQGSIEAVKDWVLPLAFLGVAGSCWGSASPSPASSDSCGYVETRWLSCCPSSSSEAPRPDVGRGRPPLDHKRIRREFKHGNQR